MQPRQRSRFLLALTASCCALLLASCTPTSSDPGPSNSPTTEATKPLPSATAALTLEEEAIATYESFSAAVALFDKSDPIDASVLAPYATPEMINVEVTELQTRRSEGTSISGSATVKKALLVEDPDNDQNDLVFHFCLDTSNFQVMPPSTASPSIEPSETYVLGEVAFIREHQDQQLKVRALANPLTSELKCD